MIDDGGEQPQQPEPWRQAFDLTMQRLPTDMSSELRSVLEAVFAANYLVIHHTRNNIQMVIQEQDARLTETITATEGRLAGRIEQLETVTEQRFRLHDQAFEVMENLLEQSHAQSQHNAELIRALGTRLNLAIARGAVVLFLILIIEVALYLAPRINLHPVDLWLLGAVAAMALGGWLGRRMWLRRKEARP